MKTRIISTALFVVLFITSSSFAAIQDGFVSRKKINSRFFTIYTEAGVDQYIALSNIALPTALKSIVRDSKLFSGKYTLATELDSLFLVVSEILDIRMKGFKCDIKVCKNAESLAAIEMRFYGENVRPGCFFVVKNNTLYIDAENVFLYVLGRELSFAIQNSYFEVPPPLKVQEILAGYVEVQLRSYTNSMNNSIRAIQELEGSF